MNTLIMNDEVNIAVLDYRMFMQEINKISFENIKKQVETKTETDIVKDFKNKVIFMHPQVDPDTMNAEWILEKMKGQYEFNEKALKYDFLDNEDLFKHFKRFIDFTKHYENKSVSPNVPADIVWHALMCKGYTFYSEYCHTQLNMCVMAHDTDMDEVDDVVKEEVKNCNDDYVIKDDMVYMLYKKSLPSLCSKCGVKCSLKCNKPYHLNKCTSSCENIRYGNYKKMYQHCC